MPSHGDQAMSRGLGQTERQILQALQQMPAGHTTTTRYLSALLDGVIDALDWAEIPRVATGRMATAYIRETRHYQPSHARLVSVQRAVRSLTLKGYLDIKLCRYRAYARIGRWYHIRLRP
jgi:hypothetical protein